ncbi:GNAT family N-acetyltransferase [Mesorhizobium sp. IMUNJ 23232]|uniref:GNAT family N-acetyltransferase n=1 Tax=Mesorhizobium sp. IMUNJ 23232 TaxID=3376064 RepID=UPI0037B24E43
MIETERLILRPHILNDFDELLAVSNDAEVMQFITHGAHATRQDVWNKLLRNIGHWTALGHGVFAVVDRQTGRYVGDTGLADFHRDLGDDFDPFPEAAWVFAGHGQGKGYATEAAHAAHRWFDAERGARRTVCIIDPDNAASIGVARKLGYGHYGEIEYKGDHVLKFERLP